VIDRSVVRRRRFVALGVVVAAVVAVVLVVVLRSGGHDRLVPGGGARSGEYDPLAYKSDREQDLARRASAGFSDVLYEKSPGGVVATARRTAVLRPQVEQAARATGASPDVLEAIVFLESAGRPDAIAGGDLQGATGLTQILASTAVDLLELHVDLPRSKSLTKRIATARAAGKTAVVRRLERARRRVDERFDPVRALEATGRYLALARKQLGRDDLAVVSYHMGIGNLQTVLRRYGDTGVSYTRLYFDTAPLRHTSAHTFLSSLGDDSSTYFWRVQAAAQIMSLSRRSPAELSKLEALQRSAGAAARRLYPNGGVDTGANAGGGNPPGYAQRLGLRFTNTTKGAFAARQEALSTLLYLGYGTQVVSGQSPLIVTSARGSRFGIDRTYRSRRQALALEFFLNRLQAWNLIAWTRAGSRLDIVVSREASKLLPPPGQIARDAAPAR
jgi:hypothetical protein